MIAKPSKDYPYRGRTVTVIIAEYLIKQTLEDGGKLRKEIFRDIRALHIENGGIDKENIVHSARKALSKLQNSKVIFSDGAGFWQFRPDHPKPLQSNLVEQLDVIATTKGIKIPKGLVPYGAGKESVYVYFIPREKNEYLLNGKSVWPCKVGKAVSSVEHRVNEQERDKNSLIDKIFLVDNCTKLEEFLKSALKLSGQYFKTDRGTEWFLTNPEIIVFWRDLWVRTVEAGS